MHAASQRLLETAPGEGGLARREGLGPDPRTTARALETMIALGWGKHPRVQEWYAWFDETAGWEDDPTAAVAILAASCGGLRPVLEKRAVGGLGRALSGKGSRLGRLGHPNLLRTDLAEVFSILASSGVEWRAEWRTALHSLQRMQGEYGRWRRTSPIPGSLPADADEPSRWVTLKATKALLTYAVEAKLPRVFPYPPSR